MIGIMVVSPCYVLPFRGGTGKGAGQHPITVSYDRREELQMRPFFISLRGALTHNHQPRSNVTANLF